MKELQVEEQCTIWYESIKNSCFWSLALKLSNTNFYLFGVDLCRKVGLYSIILESDSLTTILALQRDLVDSTLSQITGPLLGCQSKNLTPSEAFSGLLMKNNKSLEILYSKNHTRLGL